MKKAIKIILKALLCIVLVIVVAAAGLIIWLSVSEYKPEDVEELEIVTQADAAQTQSEETDAADEKGAEIPSGETLSIISWNIGYAGLGDNADFFMDGGKNVQATDEARVEENLSGIREALYGEDAYDLVLLQEVDVDSARTYGIDESSRLAAGNTVHALNHSCSFVPYPLPPIGRVNAGVCTTTDYAIDRAQRMSLPCPFSWPIRTANLKRCLLVSYLPIEGSDKQLVLVNLHLEAYDDGEGKIAQTNQLNAFIQAEYEKGNYVIAGGDFNQAFPDSQNVYPNTHPELWEPGVLTEDMLPEGWSYAYDLSVPTSRLLNVPYDPTDTVNTQYYTIDGFILSPNVTLEKVETLDTQFRYSDHNPVRIEVVLE